MNIANNNICLVVGRHLGLFICASIFVLNGCTTTMSGGPASKNNHGIRYSLPAPHIFMNPQPDGTVTVEVKYLPDPNNTYTLSLDSYLSSATFDVKMTNGMLNTLSLDADSSAITDKAVTAATEIQKQNMVTKQKEKVAEQAKEDANKAAIKAAADAVQDQKEKIALLEGKKQFYIENPNAITPEALIELKLLISQENIKLQQIETRLGLAKIADSGANDPSDAFSDPKENYKGLKNAFGPVLFRVLPTGNGGVKLVSLEKQETYQTSTSAQIDAPQTSLTFTPSEAIVKAGAANLDIVFEFSKPIKKIDKENSHLVRPADGIGAPPVLSGDQLAISLEGPELKSMKLVLPKNTLKGVYRLDVVLRVQGDDERQGVSFPIHWLVD